MKILVDRDIEGYAVLLMGNLRTGGWLEFIPLQFIWFEQVGLSVAASDRAVWRLAQNQRMLMLTANRNMKNIDSLEQTIQKKTPWPLYQLLHWEISIA